MTKYLIPLYAVIFILFCLFSFLFIDLNFIYLSNFYIGFGNNNKVEASIIYFIFISILFFLYLNILKFKNFTNLSTFKYLKFLVLIPLAGILAYPAILSYDLFNYLATAKVAFHYFENPYIVMPNEFLGESILIFTRATNKIALYGPLWTFISSLPHYLSFGNYLLEIVLLKSLVGCFFLGILYFLWNLTKSTYSLAYFALSPLVLIETFVSGHNDVVMMFAALGFIYYLRNKRIVVAIIFLILSILIKYATLFLIPVLAYYFYKKHKREQISWDFVYIISFVSMLVVFFLSPIREEIYPWYAIWPLTFLSLIAEKKKLISTFFIFFTFCLMLRYIPYMLSGNYFGSTPIIKLIITFVLPGFLLSILLFKKKFKLNR